MSEHRSTGIITFLTGLATGAALGILFAPRSGEETREAIKDRMKKGKEDLDDVIDEGHEKWKAAKGKAGDAADMTRDEVNDFVRFLFDEGQDLWDRARNAAGKATR